MAGKYTYVSIEELAEYFSVSASTIRNWISSGRIPSDCYFKGSGAYRIALEKVEGRFLGVEEEVEEVEPSPEESLGLDELDFSDPLRENTELADLGQQFDDEDEEL